MQQVTANPVSRRSPGWVAALVVVLAWVTAGAQTGPASHAGTSPGTGPYRIAGTVVNAVTGEPVRRATVAVLDEKDSRTVESVVSDADGHFVVEALPAAKYQLTASKRGFRTGFYDEHEEFSSAIVTGPDQDTAHLKFRLTPGAVLHGVVSGDGGDPIEGARVMLFLRPQHPKLGEHIQQADSATTDDAGAYEFGNLAPGEYMVAVLAEPWYAMHSAGSRAQTKQGSEASSALDVAYPVTYFDSTTDEASATPIVLTGGSREEADINVHATPALRLSIETPRKADGSIARPELRQMIFGTQISAESAGFLDAMQTGSVEFTGVAPGHYQLAQGDPPRLADMDLAASQQVDANSGAPVFTVAGSLRMANGIAPPDDVNLRLQLTNGARGHDDLAVQAKKGRFKFEMVQPGTWSLWAESGGKMLPVVSVAAGGAAHAGGQFTVRDRVPNLVATLSQGNARVEGFVHKDGKGFAGAMVVLVPRDTDAWQALTRRDQSDSDGSFSLRDVAPGQYTVLAIEDGWELDWMRPEVLGRYLRNGTAVTVNDNSGALVHVAELVTVQSR